MRSSNPKHYVFLFFCFFVLPIQRFKFQYVLSNFACPKEASSIHSFIHPSINSFIIHSSIHSSFIHSSIHPSIHSFINLTFINSSIHPFIHSFIHPSIHPSIHPFIHSFFLPSILPGSSLSSPSSAVFSNPTLCIYIDHVHPPIIYIWQQSHSTLL